MGSGVSGSFYSLVSALVGIDIRTMLCWESGASGFLSLSQEENLLYSKLTSGRHLGGQVTEREWSNIEGRSRGFRDNKNSKRRRECEGVEGRNDG